MQPVPDASRRTMLAAERTWLAWWRSGIAVGTAAIAVGGLVPQLVDGSRAPYEVIGGGYAVLAVLVFAGGARRYRRVRDQIESGGYAEVEPAWITALTVSAALLSLATLAVIIIQP
jgi:inner membrane protein YidH